MFKFYRGYDTMNIFGTFGITNAFFFFFPFFLRGVQESSQNLNYHISAKFDLRKGIFMLSGIYKF